MLHWCAKRNTKKYWDRGKNSKKQNNHDKFTIQGSALWLNLRRPNHLEKKSLIKSILKEDSTLKDQLKKERRQLTNAPQFHSTDSCICNNPISITSCNWDRPHSPDIWTDTGAANYKTYHSVERMLSEKHAFMEKRSTATSSYVPILFPHRPLHHRSFLQTERVWCSALEKETTRRDKKIVVSPFFRM